MENNRSKRTGSYSSDIQPSKKACYNVDKPTPILSKDILHHLFGFLVAKSGLVDGRSLKAASLVCKQWGEVVCSSSLWSIPAGVDNKELPRIDSMSSSLRIRETLGYLPGQQRSSRQSLIGLVKLNQLMSSSGANNFRVRERATGKLYMLSISKGKSRTPEMIKELFEAHYVQKDDFLRPCSEEELRIRRLNGQRYPLGLLVLHGTVVQWYENDTDDLPQSPLHPRRLPFGDDISHLLSLEDTLGPVSPARRHVRIDCWASIVDWIVEVVECFDLEDRTLFQAMGFLDRFVANVQQMKMSHYQLLGGACLFIAAKCNPTAIGSNDISLCADNVFNVEKIGVVEDLILRNLDWKLAFPTAFDFCIAYARLLSLDETSRTYQMMCYLSALALQSPIHLNYKQSMVAAAVLVLARFCLQEDGELWSEALERQTNYSLEEVCQWTVVLSRHLEDVRSTMPDLIMIQRRYRKASRQHVGEIAIPSVSSLATLTAYQERERFLMGMT